MQIFIKSLFIGLVAFLWSCQPDLYEDEALKHIPANATLVLTYSPKALMAKGGYDETMKWPAVQDLIDQTKKENPYFAKILQNPVESGVDLDARFYFASDVNPVENKEEESFAYWLFSIADSEKFQKLWNEMDIPAQAISNDHRYITESGNTFISWTDTWGIIGTGWKDKTRDKLREIMELDPANSLAKNKNFKKCLNQDADAAVWMGSNGLAATLAQKDLNISILANITEEDLKDNYLHHYIYFEDGLIHTESRFYIKRKISNDLDLFFHDQVKTDFSKVLPEGDLEVVMTAALNPPGINQILIEKYAKLAIQEAVKQQGLSFDDLLNALQGDIALAAYERDSTEEALFIAKIGEKDKLNNLLETAMTKGIAVKTSDQRYQINFQQISKDTADTSKKFELKGQLLIKGDMIFMASSSDLLNKVQNNEFIKTADGLTDLQSVSKQNIFTVFSPFLQTPMKEKIEVEKAIANANRKSAHLNIHLKNKKQNSLYQIMQALKKDLEENQNGPGKKI